MPKKRNPALGRLPTDPDRGPLPRRIPDDFAAVAPDHTRRELMERYSVGGRLITRWVRECGVECRRVDRTASLEAARAAGARLRAMSPIKRVNSCLTGKVDRPHVDPSRAGQAADYLRRFGPVVRCDAAGRYAPKGNHWRRGSTILTAADVIARAERNGWAPDAWKALAA